MILMKLCRSLPLSSLEQRRMGRPLPGRGLTWKASLSSVTVPWLITECHGPIVNPSVPLIGLSFFSEAQERAYVELPASGWR